jgi:predicted dehydrogenase
MINGKFQAVVLGCGNIGRTHARAILANSESVDLYGVCDIVLEKAETYQKEFDAKHVFTDYKEMLADENVDIVCVCTPSGYHAEHVIDCAKAKKHILCEKPLDVTPEKLDAMVAAYEGSGLCAASVFQYRTAPAVAKVKKMIEEGQFGKLLIANGYSHQYRSPGYYKSAGWRGTWAIDGGGSTMNQGIHTLDILCYLAGGVESIYAKIATLAREIEVEDVASAILKFKNGAVGTYQSTTLCNPSGDIMAEYFFEKGRVIFRDPGRVTVITPDNKEGLVLSNEDEEATALSNDNINPGAIGHARLIANLVAAIKGEEEVFIPLVRGRHSVDVILGLYESSRTGKEVYIESEI